MERYVQQLIGDLREAANNNLNNENYGLEEDCDFSEIDPIAEAELFVNGPQKNFQ